MRRSPNALAFAAVDWLIQQISGVAYRFRAGRGPSHPGTMRLVQRRKGRDKRAIARHLCGRGMALREELQAGRLAALRQKRLSSMEATRFDRHTLCRLCDTRVCTDCPIPTDAVAET
ncbi:MAG: hypothetical protein AAGC86_04510 [Pseudomonadota bacterium]